MTILLIIERLDWLCFIPDKDFDNYFELLESSDPEDEPEYCRIKPDSFSGPYNSCDTYLQSYCLNHARSNIRCGKWNIKAVYYLKLV